MIVLAPASQLPLFCGTMEPAADADTEAGPARCVQKLGAFRWISGSVDFGCRDAFYLLRTQGAQCIRAHTEADTWNPNSEVRRLHTSKTRGFRGVGYSRYSV